MRLTRVFQRARWDLAAAILCGVAAGAVSPVIGVGTAIVVGVFRYRVSRSIWLRRLALTFASFAAVTALLAGLHHGVAAAISTAAAPMMVALFFVVPSLRRRELVIAATTYLATIGALGLRAEVLRAHSVLNGSAVVLPAISRMGWVLTVGSETRPSKVGQVFVHNAGASNWGVSFAVRGASFASGKQRLPIQVKVSSGGSVLSAERTPVTAGWTRVSLRGRSTVPVKRVWLQFDLPAGEIVKLADLRVAANGKSARATGTSHRFSGPFVHPNLLGHSLAVSAIAVVGASVTALPALVALLLGALGTWLAGSRTAVAVLIVFGAAEFAWRFLRHRSRRAYVTLAALAIVGAFLGPIAARPFQRPHGVSSVSSRLQIFGAAVHAIREAPWTGQGIHTGGAISAQLPSGAAPVNHAHDFVLQYAVSTGVAGGLAALALLALFAVFAARMGGFEGLIVVAAVIALNTPDYTLWSVGVYLPVVGYFVAMSKTDRTT